MNSSLGKYSYSCFSNSDDYLHTGAIHFLDLIFFSCFFEWRLPAIPCHFTMMVSFMRLIVSFNVKVNAVMNKNTTHHADKLWWSRNPEHINCHTGRKHCFKFHWYKSSVSVGGSSSRVKGQHSHERNVKLGYVCLQQQNCYAMFWTNHVLPWQILYLCSGIWYWKRNSGLWHRF